MTTIGARPEEPSMRARLRAALLRWEAITLRQRVLGGMLSDRVDGAPVD